MNEETIFRRHTDFISDDQPVLCWGYDSMILTRHYEAGDYTDPIRRSLFQACAELAASRNRTVSQRHFTVWMGDYGEGNMLTWLAVPARLNGRVISILEKHLSSLTGFQYLECGRIPYMPLIPLYRYEFGRIIQYTYEKSMAGKREKDRLEGYGTGLIVQHRMWESAESLDMPETYCLWNKESRKSGTTR